MQETIDIHGMSEFEAIKTLEKFIASLSDSVTEVVVIHGHNSGRILKDMLANPNKLRSKRIKRRRYTMNQGETILELY